MPGYDAMIVAIQVKFFEGGARFCRAGKTSQSHEGRMIWGLSLTQDPAECRVRANGE